MPMTICMINQEIFMRLMKKREETDSPITSLENFYRLERTFKSEHSNTSLRFIPTSSTELLPNLTEVLILLNINEYSINRLKTLCIICTLSLIFNHNLNLTLILDCSWGFGVLG